MDFTLHSSSVGESINVNKPVCQLCLKTVANTANLKAHLKHNYDGYINVFYIPIPISEY